MTFRTHHTLQLAMSAALAARRVDILRHLFIGHGASTFALAIAPRPSREAADVLSLLAPTQRTAVLRNLPEVARTRLADAGMTCFDAPVCTRKKSTFSATRDWFLRESATADRVIGPPLQHSSTRMPMPWVAHFLTSINLQKTGVSA